MARVGKQGGFGVMVGLNCRQSVLVVHEVGHGHGDWEVDGGLFLTRSVPKELDEAVEFVFAGACGAALTTYLLLHLGNIFSGLA